MFEGFSHTTIQTSDPEVRINARYGGKGPGLLLLHGNPLTHVTWHKIAPRLAEHFIREYFPGIFPQIISQVTGRAPLLTL